MFFGEYNHALDAKNRLMLPAKLRKELGEEPVIAKSVDKCLSLYPRATWDAFCERLDAMPTIETRNVKRFLFASANDAPIDNQGRILIPSNLSEYAAFVKEVTVVGVGDHIEIWDKREWEAVNEAQNGADVAQKLIELGF